MWGGSEVVLSKSHLYEKMHHLTVSVWRRDARSELLLFRAEARHASLISLPLPVAPLSMFRSRFRRAC